MGQLEHVSFAGDPSKGPVCLSMTPAPTDVSPTPRFHLSKQHHVRPEHLGVIRESFPLCSSHPFILSAPPPKNILGPATSSFLLEQLPHLSLDPSSNLVSGLPPEACTIHPPDGSESDPLTWEEDCRSPLFESFQELTISLKRPSFPQACCLSRNHTSLRSAAGGALPPHLHGSSPLFIQACPLMVALEGQACPPN